MPLYSEMRAKDAIARELLDLDDDSEAAVAIDDAYATAVDASTDIDPYASKPNFLTDRRDTDIDVLTGDAE